jgi:hypothetical protein
MIMGLVLTSHLEDELTCRAVALNSWCVCVCVCMYVYVCIYIRIYDLSIYVTVFVSACLSSLLTCRTAVTCYMLYAQQYLFTVVIVNKIQMCSSRFNFLNSFVTYSLISSVTSLILLFHLLVNFLRVV